MVPGRGPGTYSIEQQIDVNQCNEKIKGGVRMGTNQTPTVYTNARRKEHPQKTVLQVATKSIFPLIPGASQKRTYSVPPRGHANDPVRAMQESQRRAITSIRDIALCNQFHYFITWTLNKSLIDRYDSDTVYLKLRTTLSNAVRRKGFSYVLVPEYHQKKAGESTSAIHLHGLCNLGTVPIVRATSRSGHALHDRHNRPVYNMPLWKWGYSTCVPIDDQYERTVNYIVKYITKSPTKVFGKWYLCSRNLEKTPKLIPMNPVLYDQFRDRQKLKTHMQSECEIYSGLRILSQEIFAKKF